MMLSVNLAQWRYVEELQSSKLNEHRARRLSSKLGASPTNYVKKTATTCCFSRVMPTDSIISSHAQQHPWDGERKRKAQLFHYFPPEDTEQQANKRVRVTQREVIHFRSSLKERVDAVHIGGGSLNVSILTIMASPRHIFVGGHHPNDPSYSSSALVSRRLNSASTLHASKLAEKTTIELSLIGSSPVGLDREFQDVVHPLAQMALPRSSCPQPPLDDGITGGGSSISCDVHFSGMNVQLAVLERAAPHRIVVPSEDDAVGHSGSFSVRGEVDGVCGTDNLGEERSATWNAITALATLCDEVQELEKMFQSEILPAIVLFSADDEVSTSYTKTSSKKDILDEEAQKKRESELLARIGKFLPTLQFASNGTARVRRLVKNMVVQLGGCVTPAAVPFYFDGAEARDKQSGDESASQKASGDSNNSADTKKAKEEQSMQSPVFGSGVSLNGLGKAIGTALRILVTIDTAVASNADLQEAWAMYKDVVMEWSEQKREDNTLDEEFESFERMMVQLDFSLLSSRSFVSAIEQNFDPRGRFHAAKFKLYEEIHSIVISLYGQYCEQVNTETETTERLDCVGVYAMYVLYRQLLPPNVIPDAKLHKSIWGVFPAMCPILELFGPLYFMPREFIMLHAPYERVKGCSADIAEIRSGSAALVLKWDGSFKARVSKIRLDALGWLAVADSELSPTVPDSRSQHTDENDDLDLSSSVASIERATSCILRGMKIAHSASILLRGQLVSHRGLGLDIEPDHISSLLALMEVLKSIEKLLRVRRRTAVLAFQRSTLKMIASNILKRFDKVR